MTMTPKTRLFLTIFLGVMSAMAPLSTDMYLPALPELTTDFGIPASVAQLTLTMTMIGMAAGQMIMGPVSDRYGRKGPLLAGMAVFALTALGCAAVPDIRAFLVLRFLMGFAGASGIVIARAIARDVAEGVELTRFFAILMMVNGLAPILAPVIGGQVLLFSDWRGIFVLLIAVGLVQSGATMVYRETLPQEKRIGNLGASFQKFPQLLHDKYFMGHCLTQCFVFGAFFSYIAGASFLFQNIYHVTPQTFSYIFGGIGVGLLVCGMVPARLAGRVPDVELLMGSLIVPVLGSVALLGGFLCHAPIYYTIPVLFITLSIMGAASFSLALSRQGKNAGSASALIGFAQMILGGLMMPLVGIAGSDTAVPMGIIMLTGYTLGLLTFLTLVYPDHRRGGRIMGRIK
ncbi:multidrug effflux MFS transporter [uncultured Selenomonas sp.]|uniref:multidrug effflux MFS transporter n=1 Tax=uncultured Selenomonas sp. TaxID=159275 RepID=UPI0025D9C2AB|nr:multidrug effflux MFS transporter [uncultured Selenomonas sp.]